MACTRKAGIKLKLKKDALFQWSEAHGVANQKIRNQISENVCLGYFDNTKMLYCRLIFPN